MTRPNRSNVFSVFLGQFNRKSNRISTLKASRLKNTKDLPILLLS